MEAEHEITACMQRYREGNIFSLLYVMGSKQYFNAVFLAPHDPSVIIHVLCVMFHRGIDNTCKGIGNGNEMT